jgi:hypothetical protein
MRGKLTGAWLLVAMLAALGLAGSGGEAPVAAEEKEVAKKGELPPGLDRIPGTALMVMSFRVADLWTSDIAKGARDVAAKEIAKGVKEVEMKVGIAPEQMERVTLAFLQSPEVPVVFITSRKALDRAAVLKGLVPGANEEKFKGHTIHVGQRDFSVHFLTDRTLVAGTLGDVKAVTQKPERKDNDPLAPALKAAAGKHSAVFGVNASAFERLIKDKTELPPEAAPFKALLKARTSVLTFDLKDGIRADLKVTFADADSAKAGEKSLRAALKLGQGALAQGIKHLMLNKAPAEVLKLVRDVEATSKKAPIAVNGAQVEASMDVRIDAVTLGKVGLALVQQVRLAAARMAGVNNLKQIGLALHNYHDTYGRFPPSAIYDKDGKALLSWRVLILPFIEQDGLYQKFKLNEPWDSAHNKKLLAKMPRVYASPLSPEKIMKAHKTFYQGFVGPGAFFEGKRGIRITDITDGTSNTIMIVEAANPVPWSKPEDIPYVPGKPVPKVGIVPGGLFHATFCDGSVRSFAKPPRDATFHLLIQRNDGQPIPADLD